MARRVLKGRKGPVHSRAASHRCHALPYFRPPGTPTLHGMCCASIDSGTISGTYPVTHTTAVPVSLGSVEKVLQKRPCI